MEGVSYLSKITQRDIILVNVVVVGKDIVSCVSENASPIGLVVGVAVGLVVLIIIVVVVVVVVLRRRRSRPSRFHTSLLLVMFLFNQVSLYQ